MGVVLVRHFSLAELTESDTARRRGLDNTPTAEHEAALRELVAVVLDPLREAIGRPLRVTSGYRSPALNRAIGGAAGSQHCKGEAVDVKANGYDGAALLAVLLERGIPFDQAIAYHPSRGGHLHVSWRRPNRGEVRHAPSTGGYPAGLPTWTR